jgi:large subunit ribosomal protein L32e
MSIISRRGKWKKLKPVWRKPRGIHNKIRRRFKGHVKGPSPGFGSPKTIRGLHPSGFFPVNISTPKEVSKIKEHEAILISHTVGAKKRQEIIDAADKLNIKVINR